MNLNLKQFLYGVCNSRNLIASILVAILSLLLGLILYQKISAGFYSYGSYLFVAAILGILLTSFFENGEVAIPIYTVIGTGLALVGLVSAIDGGTMKYFWHSWFITFGIITVFCIGTFIGFFTFMKARSGNLGKYLPAYNLYIAILLVFFYV